MLNLQDIDVQDCYIRFLSNKPTSDQNGKFNGNLLNIINIHMGDEVIEQVYITMCFPGTSKGPHMHEGSKTDRFFCIQGEAVLRCRNEKTQEFQVFNLSMHDTKLLIIPPYNSHQIINTGNQDCVILSMPTEGYNPDKPYNQIETIY